MKALLIAATLFAAMPANAVNLDIKSCMYMGQIHGLNEAIGMDGTISMEDRAKAHQENSAMSLVTAFGPVGCSSAFVSESARYAVDYLTTGQSLRAAEVAYIKRQLATHQATLNQ